MDGFCLNAASGCGVYWWMESSPTQSAPDTVSANLRMILRGILAALGMWRMQPVLARVRSSREPAAGRLELRDGEPILMFDTAEEGVAPGQACVLYDPAQPARVLGGGFIAGTVAAH